MELASRAMNLANRAVNSNAVIDGVLIGAFGVLSVRSVSQQREIEALESEKETLLKKNKQLKKTMWEWKQQLYADADAATSLVPLSTLKSIYGESPAAAASVQPTVDADKGEGKPAASKILI